MAILVEQVDGPVSDLLPLLVIATAALFELCALKADLALALLQLLEILDDMLDVLRLGAQSHELFLQAGVLLQSTVRLENIEVPRSLFAKQQNALIIRLDLNLEAFAFGSEELLAVRYDGSMEGIDLFDAAVADRAGIDYACVVAGVPKPRERIKASELLDPEYLALRAVFRLLHALAARPHPRYPYPHPAAATQRRLDRELGFKVTPAVNDGIVPTLSQLHGRVLHVACPDHLDLVGHYTLAAGRTADWLPSGAGFTPDAFEATWDAVAAAIAASARKAVAD